MVLTSKDPKIEISKKKKKKKNYGTKIKVYKSIKNQRIVLGFLNMAHSSWISGIFPNFHSNLRCVYHKYTGRALGKRWIFL
jgi:hypothetical protein